MKAISLLQPWATLVVMGAKKIETRAVNTRYRGEILIHASENRTAIRTVEISDKCKKFLPYNLPFGAIIGKVKLTDTLLIQTLFTHKLILVPGNLSETEKAFGEYKNGYYAWVLSDPVEFKNPIPAKAELGIWEFKEPVN